MIHWILHVYGVLCTNQISALKFHILDVFCIVLQLHATTIDMMYYSGVKLVRNTSMDSALSLVQSINTFVMKDVFEIKALKDTLQLSLEDFLFDVLV